MIYVFPLKNIFNISHENKMYPVIFDPIFNSIIWFPSLFPERYQKRQHRQMEAGFEHGSHISQKRYQRPGRSWSWNDTGMGAGSK
jgi:hypothetical protein